MFTSKFMKYWFISTTALVYGFINAYFPEVLPWETPKHLYIIQNIIISIGGIVYAIFIMSCVSEDMMCRQESFNMFGNNKLWRIWQWIYFPMMIFSIYKWEHFGIMIATIIFYFGLKVLITNHNKHYEAYQRELVVRQARQETAEKVTL